MKTLAVGLPTGATVCGSGADRGHMIMTIGETEFRSWLLDHVGKQGYRAVALGSAGGGPCCIQPGPDYLAPQPNIWIELHRLLQVIENCVGDPYPKQVCAAIRAVAEQQILAEKRTPALDVRRELLALVAFLETYCGLGPVRLDPLKLKGMLDDIRANLEKV